MLNLPTQFITLLNPFAPLFYGETTWEKAKTLVVGAILAPGKRTVSSALRVMGLSDEKNFSKYHHVLNRAVWSSLEISQALLSLLLNTFDSLQEPLVFGLDETIERRWGAKITARGIYRDPVRSSRSHMVKTSGLRWISAMLLTKIPWAQRVWALPVLTTLAPSKRYYEQRGRQGKTLTERAYQIVCQLRRWLPDRQLVVVGDSSYAVLDFLHACQTMVQPVTVITRLRLDAGLYDPRPPYAGSGRPRIKGKRQPTLEARLLDADTIWTSITVEWYGGEQCQIEIVSGTSLWYHSGKVPVPIRWVLIRDPLGEFDPLAFLSTDQDVTPIQIIEWFVRRWQVEVTFEEARAHLGVETQRQWSDLAIDRTTPALLGLFSWLTVAAHHLQSDHSLPVRQAAWYTKSRPTFSDTIALVRYHLWPCSTTFCMSGSEGDIQKIPISLFKRLLDTLCYAA
jgi:hypothetical protein